MLRSNISVVRSFSLVVIPFASLALSACGTTLPQRDLRPHEEAGNGFFVAHSAANTRGGVGNYVSRICSNGGWGAPAQDCSVAPAAPKAVPAQAQAPTKPVAPNPFATREGTQAALRLSVPFAVGSASLARSEDSELNAIADTLKSNPKLKIRIEGHTDNTGKALVNQALSEKRANSVREYLTAQGVAANQVVAKGYGAQHPVANNTNASGRAKNRRVMAVVTAR